MKYLLFIIFTCTAMAASAQQKPLLEGSYNRSSKGDPQGASHLFMLKNDTYVITYFGGAQIGKWEIIRDSVVQFTPRMPAARYALYGRMNKDLKDSIRIFFQGFEESENFIHTYGAAGEKPLMKRVFNPSPNCFGFPYVARLRAATDSVSFADRVYDSNEDKPIKGKTYTFANPGKYNDFVAYYFEEKEQNHPFYALLRKSRLYFDEDDYSEKGPLPEATSEDLQFINMLATSDNNPSEMLFNPYYKSYDADIRADSLNYTYNAAKNAWISAANYVEGEEYTNGDDAFNKQNIIYLFKAITTFSSRQVDFKIDEVPLFQVSCK